MVRQIVWSPRAQVLLKKILDYWEVRNGTSTYSKKLFKLFENALFSLAKMPESGSLTENKKIRYKIVRDYFLYYTFDDTELKVIAVSDMRRNPKYIKSLLK